MGEAATQNMALIFASPLVGEAATRMWRVRGIKKTFAPKIIILSGYYTMGFSGSCRRGHVSCSQAARGNMTPAPPLKRVPLSFLCCLHTPDLLLRREFWRCLIRNHGEQRLNYTILPLF